MLTKGGIPTFTNDPPDPSIQYERFTSELHTITPSTTFGIKRGDICLYNGSPLPQYIRQGALGTCWFIASLVVGSSDNGVIERLFAKTTESDYKRGKITLTFHYDGELYDVVIDATVPYRRYSGGSGFLSSPEEVVQDLKDHQTFPLYAKSYRQGEEWVALAEKGLAKLFGSYYNIEGGSMSTGMSYLYGGIPSGLSITNMDTQTVWDKVVNAYKNGWKMGCGTVPKHPSQRSGNGQGAGENMTSDGIVLKHAYALLRVQEEFGTKLLLLQNPWGRACWTGDWSNESPLWTEKFRNKFGTADPDKGQFFISLDDFKTYFDSLYFLRTLPSSWSSVIVKDQWTNQNSVGYTTASCLHPNSPQWCITTTESSTDFIFLLHQRPELQSDLLYACITL